MHRIGQKTTIQERVTIGKLAMAGRTDAQIAMKLDCSVWTVRKWRRIFVHQGRAGFKNQMGRPATGPLSTISEEMQTCTGYLGHLFGKTTVKGIPSLVAKDIQLRYNVKARTDARPAT